MESYDFMEDPLLFPDNPIEQLGPDGLYFDWVGLCRNGTLTFGKEFGRGSEITLSFQIYPEGITDKATFHDKPDLNRYWVHALGYMNKLSQRAPKLYAQILDMFVRHNFPIDKIYVK